MVSGARAPTAPSSVPGEGLDDGRAGIGQRVDNGEVVGSGFDRLDDVGIGRSTGGDLPPRTAPTRITELFGSDDEVDPLADDDGDDDFDVPSFLK